MKLQTALLWFACIDGIDRIEHRTGIDCNISRGAGRRGVCYGLYKGRNLGNYKRTDTQIYLPGTPTKGYSKGN